MEETEVTTERSELTEQLADLLLETGKAHHKAYLASNGADPDWPSWYAEYSFEKARLLLGATFTRSEMIYLILSADRELNQRAPGADWPSYYARFLVNRYR